MRLPEGDEEGEDGQRTVVAALGDILVQDPLHRQEPLQQRHQVVRELVCVGVGYLNTTTYKELPESQQVSKLN